MLLALPWVAHAAGLGSLTILSTLGQPLQAEVELISVQEGTLATLKARVASPEAFTKANVQYSPALSGVRLSIERRVDGRPYIKIISTRPVNEPFIDLLIELSWPQGHLVREYTALIDPPGYTPGAPLVQAVPPVELAPAVTPEPQALAPTAPVEATAAAKAPAVTRAAAPVRTLESQALAPVKAKPAAKAPAVKRAAGPARTGSKEYGPVKRGDTLSKIAASVKPEGVTLEQMLVSLYHANRDAFGSNMNILYAGSILRIPQEPQVAATAQSEAMKEVRGQAAGKETPREGLKLSKGEVPDSGSTGGKSVPREVTERLRVLEAELDALEKALTEANQLVMHLEQTVKNMRRRVEVTEQLPGVSAAGTLPLSAPGATSPLKGDQVVQPAPAKAEPPKTDPAKMEPAKDAAQATTETPGSGEPATPAAQPAAASAPTPPKPEPAKIVQAPPDLIDQILAEPLYLAGGGLVVLLGGTGYWFARRRRTQVVGGRHTQVVDVDPLAANDPLAEADLFLGFGRDHQAEEILNEVLEADPANERARLKLSQIYAMRKDKAASEKIARNEPTIGPVSSSLVAPLGALARAVETQEIARDAGAAHDAEAEAEPAVAAPDSTPKFAGATQPPAAPDKTPGAPGGETNKPGVADEPAAPITGTIDFDTTTVPAPATLGEAGTARVTAEAEPAVVAPDLTLKFPEPPAAPDKTPAAPEGETVKPDVTDEPVAPMIGTIDFYETAPAPATSDDDKDSTGDDTIIPASRKP